MNFFQIFLVLTCLSSIWLIYQSTDWLITGKVTQWSWLSLLATVLFIGGLFIARSDERKIEEANEAVAEADWKANGCPVYKSECGGKHRYECERKGVVVGRNQVGNIFVDAYPLCSK